MEIGYTPEQEAMRHASCAPTTRSCWTRRRWRSSVESHAASARPPRRIWKQMCADGWAGIGWPKEYGGQGRSAIEQFIFFDESMRAGAPVPMLTLNSVGADDHGVRHRRAEGRTTSRASSSGDIHFCIGYSEPGAGTDLASLQTRAVRDGDVVRHQRPEDVDVARRATPTTAGSRCAPIPTRRSTRASRSSSCRWTRPASPCRRSTCSATHDINAVFFEDVVVPAANVVGGREPRLEADHQPAEPRARHAVRQRRDGAGAAEVTEYAQETKLPDGRRVIDQEWVQHNLAKLHAKVEVVRLMNWQVAWEATQGVLDIGHCSALKVFGSELNMEGYQLLMEILGPVSYLEPDARARCCARGSQQGTRGSIILTFGGGVNEMQRDLISQFTLGLPRADR